MKEDKKTERLEIRLTKEEKKQLHDIAQKQEITLSDLVRLKSLCNKDKNDSKRKA